MTTRTRRSERRADALSRERIVIAAIAILDANGKDALTFRALAAHLATGSGAIYWYMTDKNDILSEATDHIVARAIDDGVDVAEPREAIRAIALSMFDAIDAHPWVGAQFFREPWRPAMLRIIERIGGRLRALGVPERAQFDACSALVNYILGVAGQNAANARLLPHGADRSAFLAAVAARWMQLDPEAYPFVRRVAAQLREHDDREQFLAGIDLILAGIVTLR